MKETREDWADRRAKEMILKLDAIDGYSLEHRAKILADDYRSLANACEALSSLDY